MSISSTRTVIVLLFLLHNTLGFGQNPDCLKSTFFKTSGTPNQAEYGTVLAHSNDGNLYLAGRDANRTFIQKINLAGEVIWMRRFVVNGFEPITPIQIFEDSEGMIVGCGTQIQFAGATRGFVFRYNPTLNTFLWAHPITSNNPAAAGILEKTPGGSYIYYQNPVFPSGETEIEILDLERATGAVIPAFASRYEYISYDILTKMVTVNGSLYGLGTVESRDSFQNQTRRLMIARFDPVNGMPIWTRMSHLDTTQSVDFLGRDLVADGDSLVAAYVGDDAPGLPSDLSTYLQKTDLDGKILWVKKYDLNTSILRILVVSDGYVLSGQRLNGGKYFVFKVNKEGDFIWGKELTYGPAAGPNGDVLGPNQAVAVADSLYFTGIATSGNADVLLWKMQSDGTMADSCGYVEDLVLTASEVPNPLFTTIQLQQLISTAVLTNTNVPWNDGSLEESLVCPDCSIPDPCPEDNDFALTFSGMDCVGGQIQLSFSYCDFNGDPADAGLNITLYNGNPFTEAADKLITLTHSFVNGFPPPNCYNALLKDLSSLFGSDNVQNGDKIFAVVNDPGTFSTPYSLNDFPISEFAECDYTNNMDSLIIQLPVSSTINLGPDQVICSNETAVLNAGPGFFKYQWSNGTSAQTANINFAGQYRVTVTDACGFRQFDTVNVQVKQLPFLFENGEFCPGKSVTIRGFTFDQEGTFQRTIPGANADCDTSVNFIITELPYQEREVTVFICPYQTVTINGEVYEDPGLVRDTVASSTGCDTIVFYFITQLPLPFRVYNFDLCPGESVTFHGNVYTQAAVFTDTLYSTGFGCDTIAYVTINEVPQQERADTIQFCPGTSVQLGGQAYTQPGVVLVNLPSLSGGCDTLVTYTLEWLPAPSIDQSIQFCPGESVIINGQSYTQPGTVLGTLPGIGGGCDTLVTYNLSWLPAPTRSETLEFCRGGSVLIGGQIYTQPGTVTQSIPGLNGTCDTVVTYTLQYLNPQSSIVSVACPPSMNVAATPGSGMALVNYALPTASSDCICPGIALNLNNGLASGSNFPIGNTQVCYAAKDSCGAVGSCCFTVSVSAESACDTKINGCMKYELLSITANAKQERTYRIRVTNSCANKLIFTAIQIPDGFAAVTPFNLTTYTSPAGRNYQVRNPNYSPFYSIRFKSIGDSIANGQSDVFEYTLPAQASQTFINITSRLATQSFYSAHLNVFNCPIGASPSANRSEGAGWLESAQAGILLFPNPSKGELFADLSKWQGQELNIQVLDSRGVRTQAFTLYAASEAQALPLSSTLPAGLYFLEVTNGNGERELGRFVIER